MPQFIAFLLSLVLAHGESSLALYHHNPSNSAGEHLFRTEYDLPVSPPGAPLLTVHVRETFTVRSLLRQDKRDMLMIPGTIGNAASIYEAPFEGYDMAAILARQGYFVSAIDLLGIGESSHPDDGSALNTAYSVPYVEIVAAQLAALHGVQAVDIYGEAGSGTASVIGLASRPDLVRTVTGSGMFYRSVNVGIAPLLSQGWKAAMDAAPGHYVYFPPEAYGQFFYASPPAVLSYMQATLPYAYPTGFFYDLFACRPGGPDAPDPPPGTILTQTVVDPTGGAVPALFIQGGDDLVALPGDSAAMAAAYGTIGGGSATAVTIAGGTHFLRFDAAGAELSHGPSQAFTSEWAATLVPWLNAH